MPKRPGTATTYTTSAAKAARTAGAPSEGQPAGSDAGLPAGPAEDGPELDATEPAAAADRPKPGPGLRCRDCGCADLRVLKSREDKPDERRRRRVCRHCGRRMTTYERPADE